MRNIHTVITDFVKKVNIFTVLSTEVPWDMFQESTILKCFRWCDINKHKALQQEHLHAAQCPPLSLMDPVTL